MLYGFGCAAFFSVVIDLPGVAVYGSIMAGYVSIWQYMSVYAGYGNIVENDVIMDKGIFL